VIVAAVVAGDEPVAQEQTVLESPNGNLPLSWPSKCLLWAVSAPGLRARRRRLLPGNRPPIDDPECLHCGHAGRSHEREE
jgi:hypothetical protein